MKLTKVHVTEFQSIRDSNEFEVGEITCLVGKNEAGKTALLQALYRLHPLVEKDGIYDVTDDYPRSDVEDYRYQVQTQKRSQATEPDFFLQLVNEEFKTDLQKTIKPADLNNSIPRLNVRLEEYFKSNAMKGKARYGHFRPARYFAENIGTLEKVISKATLDRFEEAFKKLNALL